MLKVAGSPSILPSVDNIQLHNECNYEFCYIVRVPDRLRSVLHTFWTFVSLNFGCSHSKFACTLVPSMCTIFPLIIIV